MSLTQIETKYQVFCAGLDRKWGDMYYDNPEGFILAANECWEAVLSSPATEYKWSKIVEAEKSLLVGDMETLNQFFSYWITTLEEDDDKDFSDLSSNLAIKLEKWIKQLFAKNLSKEIPAMSITNLRLFLANE